MRVAWFTRQHIVCYSWWLIRNTSSWVRSRIYLPCVWLWCSWAWSWAKLGMFWDGWTIQNYGLYRPQAHACSTSEDSLNGCTTANPHAFSGFSRSATFFIVFWWLLFAFTSELYKRITSCHGVCPVSLYACRLFRSTGRKLSVLVCWHEFRHCVIAVTHKRLDHESRRDNFIIVLEWLRSLSEKQEISLHETCILTLCQLAKSVLSFFLYSHYIT